MTKYVSLGEWFLRQSADSVAVSFTDLDELVGGLPLSARSFPAWWANDRVHRQAYSWLNAGFHVEAVDIRAGLVVFARRA